LATICSATVNDIHGFGKVAGFEQVREQGNIETPVALTSTLNVPRVADALMSLAIEQNPHIGIGFAESGRKGYASVNPVVGETTDGFLSDVQARPLGETAVRAAFGLARTGSTCHTGSGDFVIAFSTTYRIPDRPAEIITQRPTLTNEQPVIEPLGLAVIESIEEAIYNSLFMAHTLEGRDGHVRYGLPVSDVVALMRRYGR
jgi:L-aminopeptidase/D-esterase-like protein